MAHPEGFLNIVNASKARIKETDVKGAQAILQQDPDALLIDVREDSEWEAEHVKGAIHIGKGVIERDIETRIADKNRSLLLYCGGGFRSALAADALQQMGYTNPISIDGGFKAFKEAGAELEVGSGSTP